MVGGAGQRVGLVGDIAYTLPIIVFFCTRVFFPMLFFFSFRRISSLVFFSFTT